MSTENKITLRSNDGVTFDVDVAVARHSAVINRMFEDGETNTDVLTPIEMRNLNSKSLAKLIEYCKKHVENPKGDDRSANDELKNWDAEFVKVDQATLFDLVEGAHYLEIATLSELLSLTVADMFKGKTLDQIRATFNIKNDFTPEEEEEVRRESKWTF